MMKDQEGQRSGFFQDCTPPEYEYFFHCNLKKYNCTKTHLLLQKILSDEK